ncbi:uncharacterized protein VP01_1996g3 [Puccinia sorghi]|uniref:Uncharacterized protein n=1 Tax=Puccinia sorghi TaxID=27349 RepID=A0A0L6VBN7_9BASI|nr:uncharacterized protein VP01_1996g3 [Puccinia sorghi]
MYALATLWNFLRHHQQLNEKNFLMADDENIDNPTSNSDPPCTCTTKDAAMASRCMRLSNQLWNQYQSYPASNPQ